MKKWGWGNQKKKVVKKRKNKGASCQSHNRRLQLDGDFDSILLKEREESPKSIPSRQAKRSSKKQYIITWVR